MYPAPYDVQDRHDQNSALIVNDKIYAYEEEKLTSVKNESTVRFPERSLMMGMRELNIYPKDVDLWVFPKPLEIDLESLYLFFSQIVKAYLGNKDNFEKQKLDEDSKINFRNELNIPVNAFVIIMVGVFSHRKNHSSLLHAFARSPNRDKYHLLFVGDGPIKSKIMLLASQLGIDNIIYTNFINQGDLGRYYSIADLFVFPSWYDSWGLVLNEAIQFGLPVIVSNNVTSSDDLVIHGANGFLFPPNDIQSLSGLIDKVYLSPRKKFMASLSRELSLNYHPQCAANAISDALLTYKYDISIHL